MILLPVCHTHLTLKKAATNSIFKFHSRQKTIKLASFLSFLPPEIHKSKNKLYLDFSKSSTIIKETKTKLVIS